MIDIKTIRQHLVVSDNSDDRLIEIYRDAAIDYVEQSCERIVKRRPVFTSYDRFSDIEAQTPLVSVEAITYRDANEQIQTLDPTVYKVKAGLDGSISLAYGQSWPNVSRADPSVNVTLTAGYTATELPRHLFLAIIKKTLDFYENREVHEFVKSDGCDASFKALTKFFKKDFI